MKKLELISEAAAEIMAHQERESLRECLRIPRPKGSSRIAFVAVISPELIKSGAGLVRYKKWWKRVLCYKSTWKRKGKHWVLADEGRIVRDFDFRVKGIIADTRLPERILA